VNLARRRRKTEVTQTRRRVGPVAIFLRVCHVVLALKSMGADLHPVLGRRAAGGLARCAATGGFGAGNALTGRRHVVRTCYD
jgi:hypothetical protein